MEARDSPSAHQAADRLEARDTPSAHQAQLAVDSQPRWAQVPQPVQDSHHRHCPRRVLGSPAVGTDHSLATSVTHPTSALPGRNGWGSVRLGGCGNNPHRSQNRSSPGTCTGRRECSGCRRHKRLRGHHLSCLRTVSTAGSGPAGC